MLCTSGHAQRKAFKCYFVDALGDNGMSFTLLIRCNAIRRCAAAVIPVLT
jgi:hypothetical protein